MSHQDKRPRVAYSNNETGLLREAGRAMWDIGHTQSYTKPAIRASNKCLVCGTWRYELYIGDCKIGKELCEDEWEGDHYPYISISAKGLGWLQPLICWHCTGFGSLPCPVNLERDSLVAQHAKTKEVLRALPQPIFEEIWNQVGWEELL